MRPASASRQQSPSPCPFQALTSPYLCSIRPIVHGHVEATPQRTLGVAAPEQLPDLAGELANLGLADLGLRGVERRGVEVDARVLGEGVDVDGAPGVAQRGAGVLLDD